MRRTITFKKGIKILLEGQKTCRGTKQNRIFPQDLMTLSTQGDLKREKRSNYKRGRKIGGSWNGGSEKN